MPGPRGARFVVTSLGCKRAGARVLYEKLYCACGENRGAAARPVRRPDLDRDHAGEPVASRLCDVRQPPGGGEGRLGRHRGGQGAGRFGRNFSRSPSAFRFGGFRSRFRRSGPGRICSPGSWRTCGCRRPQPDAARGLDSPLAGTPATGLACSRSLPHGVVAVRNRERSSFVQGRAPDPPAEPGFGTADRPKDRAGNPEPASGFALMQARATARTRNERALTVKEVWLNLCLEAEPQHRHTVTPWPNGYFEKNQATKPSLNAHHLPSGREPATKFAH